MTYPSNKNALYIGKVFHKRHTPFTHEFTYRVFTMFIDIDTLSDSAKNLKTFSHNRFNIFSLYNKDHGPRDGSPIRPWIEKAAQEKAIDIKGGRIMMLTFPRVLGYVFNPLTVYFCYDKSENLVAILHQVKNTFGGQHGYFLPVTHDEKTIKQSCVKNFHVSPFIHMDCTYNFTFNEPKEKLNFAIHQFGHDKQGAQKDKILTATWGGNKRPLSDRALLKTLVTHPLLTLKVIIGIHWEALRLFIKGAKYISGPPAPKRDIS